MTPRARRWATRLFLLALGALLAVPLAAVGETTYLFALGQALLSQVIVEAVLLPAFGDLRAHRRRP